LRAFEKLQYAVKAAYAARDLMTAGVSD